MDVNVPVVAAAAAASAANIVAAAAVSRSAPLPAGNHLPIQVQVCPTSLD
jgi:hypothetical protein